MVTRAAFFAGGSISAFFAGGSFWAKTGLEESKVPTAAAIASCRIGLFMDDSSQGVRTKNQATTCGGAHPPHASARAPNFMTRSSALLYRPHSASTEWDSGRATAAHRRFPVRRAGEVESG